MKAAQGRGSAFAMKEYVEPQPDEVARLEQFVDDVVWGGIQFKDGPKKYGVRKSLFYYQPNEFPANYYRSDLDWKSGRVGTSKLQRPLTDRSTIRTWRPRIGSFTASRAITRT